MSPLITSCKQTWEAAYAMAPHLLLMLNPLQPPPSVNRVHFHPRPAPLGSGPSNTLPTLCQGNSVSWTRATSNRIPIPGHNSWSLELRVAAKWKSEATLEVLRLVQVFVSAANWCCIPKYLGLCAWRDYLVCHANTESFLKGSCVWEKTLGIYLCILNFRFMRTVDNNWYSCYRLHVSWHVLRLMMLNLNTLCSIWQLFKMYSINIRFNYLIFV